MTQPLILFFCIFLLIPATASSPCRLLFNEINTLFLNSEFLQPESNRAGGFVEFAFSDGCKANEKTLTSRVFVAVATRLIPSSDGMVPLFFTNFCRQKIISSNGVFTIGTSNQAGDGIDWRTDKRSGALNWLLEKTYSESIGMKGLRSYLGSTAEQTPRDILEQHAIVFAIIKNDDQKRVKKDEPSPFTKFLKNWALTGENSKRRLIEKTSVVVRLEDLDDDLMDKMRTNIEDVVVFARGEKNVRGWEAASAFFKKKDEFKFLVLPMVGDSRSIPKSLSINRVGDGWVYSQPTPGAPNIVTSVTVSEETFDVSSLTCGRDVVPILVQVLSVDVLEIRVANELQRLEQLASNARREEEEKEADAIIDENDAAIAKEDEDEGIKENDAASDGVTEKVVGSEGGTEKVDGSERGTEKNEEETGIDDNMCDAPGTTDDVSFPLLNPIDEDAVESTPFPLLAPLDTADDGTGAVAETEDDDSLESDEEDVAPKSRLDRLLFSSMKRGADAADSSSEKRPRLDYDVYGDKRAIHSSCSTDDLKECVTKATEEALRNCLPLVQGMLDATYNKLKADIKNHFATPGIDPQKASQQSIEALALAQLNEQKRKSTLSTYDLGILRGLNYASTDIEKFKNLQWVKLVSRPGGKYGLRCTLETSFDATKVNQFGHEAGMAIPDALQKHPAGKELTKNRLPRKSVKDEFMDKIRRHWNRHAPLEAHRLQCITEVLEERLARDEPLYQPRAATEKLFKAIYAQISLNMALSDHPRFMAFLDELDVRTGSKFRNDKSAASIVQTISDDFEEKLLSLFKDEEGGESGARPFSLMFDGATDQAGNHYMVFLIRFVMHDRPVTLFLKAFEMLEAGSGRYIFGLLRDYLESKGLMETFNMQLQSLASDGAMNLIGRQEGFSGRVRAHLGAVPGREHMEKQLIHVHCNSHQIELGYTAGMLGKNSGYDSNLWKLRTMTTKIVNSIDSFFGPTSHVRRFALRSVTADDEPYLSIIGIKDVRWASSEGVSFSSVIRMYRPLWSALFNLASEAGSGATKSNRAVAGAMLYVISDIRFYSYLLLHTQVLVHIADYSQSSQHRTAGYLQSQRFMAQMKNDFERLKTEPWKAPLIEMHLKRMRCRRRESTGAGSLGTVASCYEAIFLGKDFNKFEVYLEPVAEGGERLDFRQIDVRGTKASRGTVDGSTAKIDLDAALEEARLYLAELEARAAGRDVFDADVEETTRRTLTVLKAYTTAQVPFQSLEVISALLDSVLLSFEERFGDKKSIDRQEALRSSTLVEERRAPVRCKEILK